MNYKIKEISEIINGATPSTSKPNYWNGNIDWITPKDLTNFSGRFIFHGRVPITKEGYDSCSTKLVPEGTILLSSRAPIGYLAIAGKEVCTNQGFKSIICNPNKVNNIYLYYWLSTKVDYLQSISNGATFKELSKETLENVLIDLPTMEKQQHIVNTIGSVDDLIENYQERINKIADILSKSLEKYPNKITIDHYNPILIKSGINKFNDNKEYLDTSSVEGINNISIGETITYDQRPSRANMQPIPDSVWFAKMKGSYKNLIIGKSDVDLIDSNILSTGFQGIKASRELPLSLLTAFIISKEFNSQRDLNSVGTTMAGINNETFMKINVPLLTESKIKEFDNKYRLLVDELSILRRKINSLKQEKSLLLSKYF